MAEKPSLGRSGSTGPRKVPAAKPATGKAAAPRPASGEVVAAPEGYESLIEPRGALSDVFAPVGGFGVTLSNMFRPTVTEQYPSERVPPKPRYHGRHQLNRYADGLEKCIGCELCAWACPADAIYVEGGDNTPEDQHSPGERYGSVYQINYLRCIFCGLCIEACPTRALTMTNVYELVSDQRGKLIFEKDQLLAPVQEGMVAPPHAMADGMRERDYYLGKITTATPEQRAWADTREAHLAQPGSTAAASKTTTSSEVSDR